MKKTHDREYIALYHVVEIDGREVLSLSGIDTSNELIRCEGCRYYDQDSMLCRCWKAYTDKDGFCSYGKRRKTWNQ